MRDYRRDTVVDDLLQRGLEVVVLLGEAAGKLCETDFILHAADMCRWFGTRCAYLTAPIGRRVFLAHAISTLISLPARQGDLWLGGIINFLKCGSKATEEI
jgi:hypothetical protein